MNAVEAYACSADSTPPNLAPGTHSSQCFCDFDFSYFIDASYWPSLAPWIALIALSDNPGSCGGPDPQKSDLSSKGAFQLYGMMDIRIWSAPITSLAHNTSPALRDTTIGAPPYIVTASNSHR